MAGLSTGAPIVQVYHEKSIILPDVSRVLACLYEKDIKFKTHTASYKSLLRLQALSHAPVPFYDGPKFLEESREICRYIAEKYEHQGYPFLLGKDALERASVEQWLHNEEHAFNPPSRALFCHLAFPLDEEDDGNDIDIHTRKLEEVLEVYEQRLSDSEFLAGNKFTLADLVHLPNSHYITASDKFLYLYDSRKNVRRWWDAISTRDSWKQVLRDMKTVEEQHKQELKKQQQQKEHPTTSGHPIRIDPLKKTSTEPWTILVPPADTVSSSPTVPQIEKPLATDIFPDGALASSSQSTPIAHETSVAQSKETTFFTTPQEKPTIAQKPPIVDVAKSITKEASSPEPTETDLPTRHKPSSVKDVAPSTQLISSTEPRNGIAIVAAPSRAKDSQTTPGRQDILSAPVGLVPPFSDTQHPSGEVQEYVPADDSGKAKPSKPSSAIREESPPTVVPASAPDTQHGTEPDDVALDEQKFSPSGQDSTHPIQTASSAKPRNEEIRDSAPSTQLISSIERSNGDATVATSDQAKDLQTTPGRQDILSAPIRSVSQRPSGEVQEDVLADDSGKAKPSKPSSAVRADTPPTMVPASAPDTQHGTEPDDVALGEQKISPSGAHPIKMASSAKPRNEEIRDSVRSTQLISSIEQRNGDEVATSDQAKDSQTTPGRQDIDTQHPSGKVQVDVPADDSGETKASKPPSTVREDSPTTVVPASAPDTQKLAPSGQDSARPVKPSFSTEPTKEAAADKAKTPFPDTQDASRKVRDNTPDDHSIDESLPSQEQVSLGGYASEPREGQSTYPYRTDVNEKITKSPSSQENNSEVGPDLTPARHDRPSIGDEPTKSIFPEHGAQPPVATQDVSIDALGKAKSSDQEAMAPIADPASIPDTQRGTAQGQESAHTSEPPSSTEPRKEETNAATADQTNVPETIFDHQVTRLTPDAREALRKDQESSHDDYHGSTLANPLIVNQEQAHTHAGRASEPREEPTPDVHSAGVDRKTTLPPSQAQTSNTGPDSTPISGDVAATSSIQNQEAQPPVATQVPTIQAPQGLASTQNIPYDSLGKIEPPIPPSTDQVMAPIKSPAAPSDDPQGTEPDRNSVRPQQEASFELPSGEETAMSQGDQVNTLPNGNLSDNQVVGQFERERSKGMNSQKNLEGTSADEKSKTQLQTDSSNTQSSKDNNNEVNGTTGSNISATFGELQKQPSRPMESIESSKEPEHQQQADQAIVQSLQGNNKQVEETKAQDTGTDKPEEMEPPENTNQKNNRISQAEALDHSGKQASGVQQLDENTKNASNPTEDTPGGLQNLNKSKDNLRYSEESKLQVQTEGKIQGGETEAPISETEQLKERGLPANSYRNNSSQSQAEASDKSIEQSSPGIQNKNKNSSRSDGSTNDTESGNMED
ncbi:uncharacterized protein LOC133902093 isoform X2 [Phragmites australis]|uniref:uncharacterized protein LOC133902093 isoform X2 n=1 Tax=Phragmites australis TaxID=29695 RepID=UPI002D784B78|nr:uncharacterized protein LOC133902093 isoform X2 [Phragmites australis]